MINMSETVMLTMTTNCLKPTSRTFNDDDNESHKKNLMLECYWTMNNEQGTMNNVNNVMTARSKTRPKAKTQCTLYIL